MAKTKISEYDAVAANNTDVNSINIAEGCAPSGINNAIRQVMADLKDFQQGTKGDPFLGSVTPTTLTLSSLTANRVLYTNGSKVVATSDNMQFDGTTTTINALTVSGAFAANGGATLGDGSGDALTINSSAVTIPNGLNFGSNNLVLSSGNVGVGTSSPASKLDVVGTLRLTNTANSSNYGLLSDLGGLYIQSLNSNPIYFATGGSERMRITSTGNVGIGTSSPTCKLDVQGASGLMAQFLETTSGSSRRIRFANSGTVNSIESTTGSGATQLAFLVDGSERMRIDEYGNLLVGTTTATLNNAGFHLVSDGNTIAARMELASTSTTNSNIGYSMYSTGAGAYRFFIGYGGTIYATSIVITAISDQRLKENIKDIDTGLDSIMALKPRRFDWKEGKGQDKKNVAGFIAQEFENVFPECVSTTLAGEDGIEYKNINHETLIPTLVKAIQEQQAIITDLKARIESLENK